MGASGRWRASAPWARPTGAIPILRRTRRDRAGPCQRRVDPLHRQGSGTLALDDEPGAGPSQRRQGAYRATTAHPLADERASRPKPAKLVTNVVLRERVEWDLEMKYSPEQIAGRRRDDHPDDPEMWVSTETIYQCLYVQSRGALRRDLVKCLRTGRRLRQPHRQGASARTAFCTTWSTSPSDRPRSIPCRCWALGISMVLSSGVSPGWWGATIGA